VVIYAFVSSEQWTLRALTSDASGANLPAEYGPWRKADFRPILLLVEAKDPVYKVIKRSGFLLQSGSFKRRASSN
jgi:hypothetical protein